MPCPSDQRHLRSAPPPPPEPRHPQAPEHTPVSQLAPVCHPTPHHECRCHPASASRHGDHTCRRQTLAHLAESPCVKSGSRPSPRKSPARLDRRDHSPFPPAAPPHPRATAAAPTRVPQAPAPDVDFYQLSPPSPPAAPEPVRSPSANPPPHPPPKNAPSSAETPQTPAPEPIFPTQDLPASATTNPTTPPTVSAACPKPPRLNAEETPPSPALPQVSKPPPPSPRQRFVTQAAFQRARRPPAKQAGKLQGLRIGVKSASSWLEGAIMGQPELFPHHENSGWGGHIKRQ